VLCFFLVEFFRSGIADGFGTLAGENGKMSREDVRDVMHARFAFCICRKWLGEGFVGGVW